MQSLNAPPQKNTVVRQQSARAEVALRNRIQKLESLPGQKPISNTQHSASEDKAELLSNIASDVTVLVVADLLDELPPFTGPPVMPMPELEN